MDLLLSGRWPCSRSASSDPPLRHGYYSRCSNCKYTPRGHVFCPAIHKSRITQGEIDNSKQYSLHCLPPELVYLILEELSSPDIVCLRQTCRLFYHNYSSFFCPLTSDESFQFRCLLERDHPAHENRICFWCKERHPISWFFEMDINKKAHHRYCKTKKPVLLICPYTTMSFSEVLAATRSLTEGSSVAAGCYDIACNCNRHGSQSRLPRLTLRRGNYFLISESFLGALYDDGWPSLDELDAILKDVDIPLCPHWSLPYLLSVIDSDFRQKKITCGGCHSEFRFCISHPYFEVKPSVTSITLVVERNLGKLERFNDPTWLSQLSVTKQPELQAYWSERLVSTLMQSSKKLIKGLQAKVTLGHDIYYDMGYATALRRRGKVAKSERDRYNYLRGVTIRDSTEGTIRNLCTPLYKNEEEGWL